jgi:hypothetical protein
LRPSTRREPRRWSRASPRRSQADHLLQNGTRPAGLTDSRKSAEFANSLLTNRLLPSRRPPPEQGIYHAHHFVAGGRRRIAVAGRTGVERRIADDSRPRRHQPDRQRRLRGRSAAKAGLWRTGRRRHPRLYRVEGYDAEGRWTGTWNGTYEAPDGRRYDGTYEGTVEGRPGVGYPPPAYDPYYSGGDPRHDEDMQRRCGNDGTVGGAVVGGVVGGIAGNRIAGRGNRTAGTLIGGGLGGLAGAAIGNSADRAKCEQWWAGRRGHPSTAYRDGYSSSYSYGGYGQGYGQGYGWYTPGVVVTTIITNGAPIVTETVETSTRTYYENVPVRKRVVAKKKWKPKPKPRCVC